MPFKGVDVMDVKKEFVLKSLDQRIVFTELCREYEISTKCGYKWRKRFLEEGYSGLEERSRKPLSNSRSIPKPVSVEILRIKKLHPAWGAKKIQEIYKRNHARQYASAHSRVSKIYLSVSDIPGSGGGEICGEDKYPTPVYSGKPQ